MSSDLKVHELPDDREAVDDFFYERDWSDGLPIIPPTPDRVSRMVQACSLEPTEVIGPIPVTNRVLDVESLAVNAVMAGCRPVHFPAVIAATRGIIQSQFNLASVQATTHPAAPLAVYSGKVVQDLEMNDGAGVFGPGNRALAVIGRAVRLTLICVGGGVPGRGDQASHGHPGKYTFAIADASESLGWEPLASRLNPRLHGDSAVTMVACEAPRNVNDHGSESAGEFLGTVAGSMSTLGPNNLYRGGPILVVLGPEHARLCRADGFDPAKIQQNLFERARVSLELVSEGNLRRFRKVRSERFAGLCNQDSVPVTTAETDILVFVSGGDGRHSMVLPSFGISEPAIEPI